MTPTARMAALLRITEGQVYTVVTSLALSLLLLGIGLPSLRDVPVQLADEPVRTTPLALSGSPAVADVIVAAAPPPTPEVAVATATSTEFAGAPPSTVFSTPPRIVAPPTSTTPPRATEPTPAAAEPSGEGSESPTATAPAPPPSGLRITEARYATASGPLVPSGPPGAFLPVGLRLGSPDKQSYLRLSGSGTTLELKLSPETAHQFGEVNAVRACRIVPANWTLADGAPLASAPQVDPIDCTLGRPGATSWTFELSGIDTSNGVALVPSGPSTGTFQVTFTGGVS